jgi:hypothetical protein
MVTAQTRFTLYDVLTGETVNSNTADTKGFAFTPVDDREQTILAESRRALQFLYDAKKQAGAGRNYGGYFREVVTAREITYSRQRRGLGTILCEIAKD